MYKALVDSLKPYKGKLDYTPTDLKEGLVGVFNYKINAPQFDSQTKEKLVDGRVKGKCYEECLKAFNDFFTNNKTLAKDIVTRAAELRKKTADFLKDKKLIKNVKNASRGLSTKLADVSNSKIPFSERELYLVEGDSAGGCFTGDTQLLLASGGTITYEKLLADHKNGIEHIGFAYDQTNKKAVPFKFFEPRVTKHTKHLMEISLEDGQTYRCTLDHKWLTSNRGWVEAQHLIEGDDIVNISAQLNLTA